MALERRHLSDFVFFCRSLFLSVSSLLFGSRAGCGSGEKAPRGRVASVETARAGSEEHPAPPRSACQSQPDRGILCRGTVMF